MDGSRERKREKEIAANLFDKIISVVAGEDPEEAGRAVWHAGGIRARRSDRGRRIRDGKAVWPPADSTVSTSTNLLCNLTNSSWIDDWGEPVIGENRQLVTNESVEFEEE